jgi:hypothetical protein
MIEPVRRNEPVRCPICNRTVKRKSRQQVYCSPKCMRKGNYVRKAGLGQLVGQDTALIPNPPKKVSENNILQWPKWRSSILAKGLRSDGIVGPRSVIQTEVIAGRKWEEVVSSSGVRSYISRLTRRALRDGASP